MSKSNQIVGAVISIFIIILFSVTLYPVVDQAFESTDTSNWSTGTKIIWSAMPIILGIILPGFFIILIIICDIFSMF